LKETETEMTAILKDREANALAAVAKISGQTTEANEQSAA
jgi:hypothetical protein